MASKPKTANRPADVIGNAVHVMKVLTCEADNDAPVTNGHSKKVANHAHMVALYTMYYNFIRTHSKLKMTPAMQAGIAPTFLSFADVLVRVDAAQVSAVRGPYNPRATKAVAA